MFFFHIIFAAPQNHDMQLIHFVTAAAAAAARKSNGTGRLQPHHQRGSSPSSYLRYKQSQIQLIANIKAVECHIHVGQMKNPSNVSHVKIQSNTVT